MLCDLENNLARYATASDVILLTCFDFRPEASTDQMSSSPKEGASVKEDADEEPVAEWQGRQEGNEDALVGTAHSKI